ncbi:MAG: PHP-associated domain-containing protein [Candidatus Bathyarchaeia archaeon]
MHVHTVRSEDSSIDIPSLVAYARIKNLEGVAITDHNVAPTSSLIEEIGRKIVAVPGLEVKTEVGHMIGLGVTSIEISGRVYAQSFIDYIHRLGGIVVLAHPNPMRMNDFAYNKLSGVDCVEVLNASLRPYRIAYARNYRLAEVLETSKLGGSDSHIPYTIGDAYTIVECDGKDWRDIVEAISAKLCRPAGRASSLSSRALRMLIKLSSLSSTLSF